MKNMTSGLAAENSVKMARMSSRTGSTRAEMEALVDRRDEISVMKLVRQEMMQELEADLIVRRQSEKEANLRQEST